MAELFSDELASAYMHIWNSDSEITSTLGDAEFSSVVAFGDQDEEEPRFVMTIENGDIVSEEKQPSDMIKWDLRAGQNFWLARILHENAHKST